MGQDADMDRLEDLRLSQRRFVAARDWEQFHTPRNLAMALAGEVGELLSTIQWLTDDEVANALHTNDKLRATVEDEVADIMLYLVRFAEVAKIDLIQVARAKLVTNEHRYPIELSKGNAVKYDQLPNTSAQTP